MKWGRGDDRTRTKTSKKKGYQVSSLQFTVFVAEGEAWGNVLTLGEPNEASHLISDIS